MPGGGALQLRDVARIELGREDTGLIAHTNGQPGITAIVVKQETADIVDTVDRVKEVVESTALPAGVSFAYVRDESFMARNRLNLMWNNGLMGVALISLVLFVFLTPVSAAWTLAGLPLVFLGTLALFPVAGFRINMVTLTGLVIVLGMVVDDAIVLCENVFRHLENGKSPTRAAIDGTREVAAPVLCTVATTVAAFLPMLLLSGDIGKYMHVIPVVVCITLAFSLYEALFALPVHITEVMSLTRGRPLGG